MSKRTRTVEYIESKIIKELSKKQAITTPLALTSSVLRNIRSLEEDHNLDIAITNLLSKKLITKEKDKDGFIAFRLVA